MRREVRFHRKVPSEVREFIKYYESISESLADGFWTELTKAIDYAAKFPERHHFDPSGKRRSNLKRFPYTVSYSANSMVISAFR